MITVDDLISVWLHRNNPKSEVKVWSIKKGDYIFSTSKPEDYDITPEDCGKLKVSNFMSYYSEEFEKDKLIINVEQKGEIK